MATVLRIKRKREEQPLPSLVLSTHLSTLSSSSSSSSSTTTDSIVGTNNENKEEKDLQNDRPLRFRRLCSWDPTMSRKENTKQGSSVAKNSSSSSHRSPFVSSTVPSTSSTSSISSNTHFDREERNTDSMPLLPNNVASAVRAAWEVQETRKNIAKRQQQQQLLLLSSSSSATTSSAKNTYNGFNTEDNSIEGSFEQQYNLLSNASWANRQTVPIRVFDVITSLSSSSPSSTAATIPHVSSSTVPSLSSLPSTTNSKDIPSSQFPTVKLLRRWDTVPIHYSSLPPSKPGSTTTASPSKTTHPNAKPILNPFERQMDEAIWRCFRMGDIQGIYASLRNGGDVNFYRKQDHTTPLMGAAFLGDESTVLYLLKQKAYAHWKDTENRTAADYADINHHHKLGSMLRDTIYHELVSLGLTDDTMNMTNSLSSDSNHRSTDDDEEIYDIYILDQQNNLTELSSTSSSSSSTTDVSMDNGATYSSSMYPPSTFYLDPVSFSIARDAALGGPSGWDLVYENPYSNKEEDEDYDSEDSNIEDAPGNEYPEERDYRLLRIRKQLRKKNREKNGKTQNTTIRNTNDDDDEDDSDRDNNNNDDTDSFDANDDDDDDSAYDEEEEEDYDTTVAVSDNYEQELMKKINEMILQEENHDDNNSGSQKEEDSAIMNDNTTTGFTSNSNDNYEI